LNRLLVYDPAHPFYAPLLRKAVTTDWEILANCDDKAWLETELPNATAILTTFFKPEWHPIAGGLKSFPPAASSQMFLNTALPLPNTSSMSCSFISPKLSIMPPPSVTAIGVVPDVLPGNRTMNSLARPSAF